MRIFRVYCDGAFDHQRKMGAMAFAIVEDNKVMEKQALSSGSSSANLMEMHSVAQALEGVAALGATKNDLIYLYTDFKPICDAFSKGWLSKWKENGWLNSDGRAVKHKEVWEVLDHLVHGMNVQLNYERKMDINMLPKLKRRARAELRLI